MIKFSITKNGKPLDKSLYVWDEVTQTLSTKEDNLVLDFSGYSNCIFNTGFGCTFNTSYGCTFNTSYGCTFSTGSDCIFVTGSYCTFNTGHSCTFDTDYNCTFSTGSNCIFRTSHSCTFSTGYHCTFSTGSDCTFKTGSYCTFSTSYNCIFITGSNCTFDADYNCTFNTDYDCTFDTGSDCIFKTGSDCTFNTKNRCVITRRDIFEFYDISNVNELTLAPFRIEGYIKDGYYYNDNKKQYKAIIVDNILSEIVEHKGNIYKVKNYGKKEISYLVQDGDVYSHGKTLKEAKESLIYKLSNRDTSRYKDYTLDTKVTKKEAIQMYRVITGACEQGTRMFVECLGKVPRNLTVKKIIELTKGQYGNDTFKKFFERASE